MSVKTIAVIVALLVVIGVLGLVVSQEGGLTGGVVANSIACQDNRDCDDKIEGTEDICRSPGTINALCVNRPRN